MSLNDMQFADALEDAKQADFEAFMAEEAEHDDYVRAQQADLDRLDAIITGMEELGVTQEEVAEIAEKYGVE